MVLILTNVYTFIFTTRNIKDTVYWKTYTTWELWVKFYLGQNEDYSLGDSLSDSSEELLWRSGEVSLYVILVKGDMCTILAECRC